MNGDTGHSAPCVCELEVWSEVVLIDDQCVHTSCCCFSSN